MLRLIDFIYHYITFVNQITNVITVKEYFYDYRIYYLKIIQYSENQFFTPNSMGIKLIFFTPPGAGVNEENLFAV